VTSAQKTSTHTVYYIVAAMQTINKVKNSSTVSPALVFLVGVTDADGAEVETEAGVKAGVEVGDEVGVDTGDATHPLSPQPSPVNPLLHAHDELNAARRLCVAQFTLTSDGIAARGRIAFKVLEPFLDYLYSLGSHRKEQDMHTG
jgi:hypothetical protein